MTASFICLALLHCNDNLKKDLTHLNTLTEAKIEDEEVIKDFEKDKKVVKDKMKTTKQFVIQLIQSFIFERYLDVEPEIRSKSIILAAEVLKYLPELRTKRFFKILFENGILDSSGDIVLTALKSLSPMIINKDLKDFFNKFWGDNTKLII